MSRARVERSAPLLSGLIRPPMQPSNRCGCFPGWNKHEAAPAHSTENPRSCQSQNVRPNVANPTVRSTMPRCRSWRTLPAPCEFQFPALVDLQKRNHGVDPRKASTSEKAANPASNSTRNRRGETALSTRSWNVTKSGKHQMDKSPEILDSDPRRQSVRWERSSGAYQLHGRVVRRRRRRAGGGSKWFAPAGADRPIAGLWQDSPRDTY